MTMRMPAHTIEVTEEHISEGEPNEPKKCPIALALSDKTKNKQMVVIDCVYLEDNDDWIQYAQIGPRLRKFIKSFDGDSSSVSPITIGVYEDNNNIRYMNEQRYMEVVTDGE